MNVRDAAALGHAWDERVRANREQVERVRQGAEADDFYAPVTARFIDDPRRSGDAVLDALLELAEPQQRWLDIGAGAGRYALPLALAVREVLAVEPSPAMVANLRAGMATHGISNVTIIETRWPPDGDSPSADVALIAHVGYDVEPILPFLDAMERAAGTRCVAVLMDRAPAGYASPFWPEIHGMERVALPALDEFVELLGARGAHPRVRPVVRAPRTWPDRDTLLLMLRHQLWIPAGGPQEARLAAALESRVSVGPDGVRLSEPEGSIGIVDWLPSQGLSADG
jgi:SAM-dependent methyltransferase